MTDVAARANDLFQDGRSEEALDVLRHAAQSGDTEAEFQLGMVYYDGVYLPGDLDLAWDWLEEADKDGHLEAPYFLGRICTYLSKHEMTVNWYERSSKRGFHKAKARIGYNYWKGIGVDRRIEPFLTGRNREGFP